MTSNQINFWNLQKTAEHNQLTRAEQERHNRETERLTQAQIDESIRANKEREAENYRSNQAQEDLKRQGFSLNAFSNLEEQRHNKVTEQINLMNLANSRDLTAVQQQNAQANLLNARANQTNAQTRIFEAETGRLTQSTNAAIARSNELLKVQELAETRLHNRKTEQANIGSTIGRLIGSLGSSLINSFR